AQSQARTPRIEFGHLPRSTQLKLKWKSEVSIGSLQQRNEDELEKTAVRRNNSRPSRLNSQRVEQAVHELFQEDLVDLKTGCSSRGGERDRKTGAANVCSFQKSAPIHQ